MLNLCFSKPFNLKAIVSGLDALCGHPSSQKIWIDVIAIDDPEIARIGEDVEPASAVIENTAHSFATVIALRGYRTHLAPPELQNIPHIGRGFTVERNTAGALNGARSCIIRRDCQMHDSKLVQHLA